MAGPVSATSAARAAVVLMVSMSFTPYGATLARVGNEIKPVGKQ
jgi:hypothetical protein